MKRFLLGLIGIIGFTISVYADTAAQYPGGTDAMNAFIAENMKYPEFSKENGIEGMVHLTVVIKEDGSIGTIKVDRMVDPDLEQEAIRIVKEMPAWQPATSGDTPVASEVKIVVPFSLGE